MGEQSQEPSQKDELAGGEQPKRNRTKIARAPRNENQAEIAQALPNHNQSAAGGTPGQRSIAIDEYLKGHLVDDDKKLKKGIVRALVPAVVDLIPGMTPNLVRKAIRSMSTGIMVNLQTCKNMG